MRDPLSPGSRWVMGTTWKVLPYVIHTLNTSQPVRTPANSVSWLLSSVDSRVIQTPKHLIKAKWQLAAMRCSPVSEPLFVSEDLGPETTVQYYNREERWRNTFLLDLQHNYLLTIVMNRIWALWSWKTALFLWTISIAQPCLIISKASLSLVRKESGWVRCYQRTCSDPEKWQAFVRHLWLRKSV